VSLFLTVLSLNFVENVGLISKEWLWNFFAFAGLLNLVFVKQLEFVVVGMGTVVAVGMGTVVVVGMGIPFLKLRFMEVSGWCIT
jgi:hypothetical protein